MLDTAGLLLYHRDSIPDRTQMTCSDSSHLFDFFMSGTHDAMRSRTRCAVLLQNYVDTDTVLPFDVIDAECRVHGSFGEEECTTSSRVCWIVQLRWDMPFQLSTHFERSNCQSHQVLCIGSADRRNERINDRQVKFRPNKVVESFLR